VLARVREALLGEAVEDESGGASRLVFQAIHQPVARALRLGVLVEVQPERGQEAHLIQLGWAELEDEMPQAPHRVADHALELVELDDHLLVLDASSQGVEPHPHRRDHLDRVVVQVLGEASPLVLVGRHQPLHQTPVARRRLSEELQAPLQTRRDPGYLLGCELRFSVRVGQSSICPGWAADDPGAFPIVPRGLVHSHPGHRTRVGNGNAGQPSRPPPRDHGGRCCPRRRTHVLTGKISPEIRPCGLAYPSG
jgi:hypothetical protein